MNLIPYSIFVVALQNSDLPGDSDNKEFTCNGGDSASIPGSGRSPGRRD